MYILVSKCNKNLPVVPLRPEHIYSTDDTTTYCYEGKGEKSSSFVLVGSNTMTKAGSRSRYLPGDTKQMCGLRVKLTDGILGDQSFGVLVGLHLELILMIIIVNLIIECFCCCSMFLFYFILVSIYCEIKI